MTTTKVQSEFIAADAVTGAKIADDAIDSEHYTDGSIDSAHIADNAITSAKIATGVVIAADIANDSIDSQHYVAASIDNEHLADDAVDSDELAAGSVDLAHMSVNSIDSDQYVDGSIDSVHLAADVVTGAKIADDAIDSEHYAAGSIDNEHLADDAVDSDELAAGSVDLAHLSASGTRNSGTFYSGDGTFIATSSIGDITSLGTIGTGVWQGTAIASGYIAADAVDSDELAAGSVDLAHLSASGTRNSGTFYRGDGTFAAFSDITSLGTLTGLTGGTGDFNWDSNTLVVDSSASMVGIGTASPGALLETYNATDNTKHWRIHRPGTAEFGIGISGSDMVISTSGNMPPGANYSGVYLRFNTAFIGINKPTPAYTLDVDGDINFTGTLREDGSEFSGGISIAEVIVMAG